MDVCSHPPGRSTTLFRARDYVTGDAFEIRRCGECGLALTAPAPGLQEMGRYYPDAYYGVARKKRFVGPVEALQRALYGWRARAVERAAGGRPGRVLDVGCGRGFLLEAFRGRGWTVEGTEMSEASSAHAREVLGIPVHLGPVEALGLAPGAFDAVTIWHVLEHVAHPGPLLREVHRLMRPGAALLVGVPNFASPEARLAGPGWFHLDVPRHLAHFTPATLDAALRDAGFTPIRTGFLAPEFDAFSFVQSVLNRLGLGQNALYQLLRERSARFDGGSGASAAISAVLAAPLGILSLPVTLAAGLAGAGSSMTVLARRS